MAARPTLWRIHEGASTSIGLVVPEFLLGLGGLMLIYSRFPLLCSKFIEIPAP